MQHIDIFDIYKNKLQRKVRKTEIQLLNHGVFGLWDDVFLEILHVLMTGLSINLLKSFILCGGVSLVANIVTAVRNRENTAKYRNTLCKYTKHSHTETHSANTQN